MLFAMTNFIFESRDVAIFEFSCQQQSSDSHYFCDLAKKLGKGRLVGIGNLLKAYF